MNIKFRIIKNAVIAILLVVAINFLVLYYLNFPSMAISQIKKYLVLLIFLVVGFGVQIGLYTYLKYRDAFCSITTMAGGGISSISMILCCSHYLLNILPFISLSFASFLTKYTLYILVFGVLSNLIGIYIMYRKIRGGKNG